MAGPEPDPDRLLELLDALCDGRMGAAESAELGIALENSAAARRAYIEYLDMEINIRRLHPAEPGAVGGDPARDCAVATP